MKANKHIVLVSMDYALRMLSVLAIANVLLISTLVTFVDKNATPPTMVQVIGLPLTLLSGIGLMGICAMPGVIANLLKCRGDIAWFSFRLPSLIVTGYAVDLFLLS